MSRLYPMLLFACLVLVVPVESAGQDGVLSKLSEVDIVVEDFINDEKKLGITKDEIKNQVFVFLRGKLPKLRVSKSAYPFVYIRVSIKTHNTGYFGAVDLKLNQGVTIRLTGKWFNVYVWESMYLVFGSPGTAPDNVRSTLESLLTKFAADWYRDNP